MAVTPGESILKLYCPKLILPNVSRVLACLYEKDVKFERINLAEDNRVRHDLLSLQTSRRPPVMVLEDGRTYTYESRALCRHIAQKYAERGNRYLLGRDMLERAAIEQWLKLEEQRFDPPSWDLFFNLTIASMPDADLDRSRRQLAGVLDVYEERLSVSEFLAGNEFSIVDLSHIPNLHRIPNSELCYLFDSRMNVSRWWQLISKRPSWLKVTNILNEVIIERTAGDEELKEERRHNSIGANSAVDSQTTTSMSSKTTGTSAQDLSGTATGAASSSTAAAKAPQSSSEAQKDIRNQTSSRKATTDAGTTTASRETYTVIGDASVLTPKEPKPVGQTSHQAKGVSYHTPLPTSGDQDKSQAADVTKDLKSLPDSRRSDETANEQVQQFSSEKQESTGTARQKGASQSMTREIKIQGDAVGTSLPNHKPTSEQQQPPPPKSTTTDSRSDERSNEQVQQFSSEKQESTGAARQQGASQSMIKDTKTQSDAVGTSLPNQKPNSEQPPPQPPKSTTTDIKKTNQASEEGEKSLPDSRRSDQSANEQVPSEKQESTGAARQQGASQTMTKDTKTQSDAVGTSLPSQKPNSEQSPPPPPKSTTTDIKNTNQASEEGKKSLPDSRSDQSANEQVPSEKQESTGAARQGVSQSMTKDTKTQSDAVGSSLPSQKPNSEQPPPPPSKLTTTDIKNTNQASEEGKKSLPDSRRSDQSANEQVPSEKQESTGAARQQGASQSMTKDTKTQSDAVVTSLPNQKPNSEQPPPPPPKSTTTDIKKTNQTSEEGEKSLPDSRRSDQSANEQVPPFEKQESTGAARQQGASQSMTKDTKTQSDAVGTSLPSQKPNSEQPPPPPPNSTTTDIKKTNQTSEEGEKSLPDSRRSDQSANEQVPPFEKQESTGAARQQGASQSMTKDTKTQSDAVGTSFPNQKPTSDQQDGHEPETPGMSP